MPSLLLAIQKRPNFADYAQAPIVIIASFVGRGALGYFSNRILRCISWTIPRTAWGHFPLDGISPKDIRIAPLLERIDDGIHGSSPLIKEVIFALDADLEGDTTVLYLAKILKDKRVQSSRIAHGVPIGGDIDFIDHRTLERALENRVQV